METLAIVAYHQPMTRPEIEHIRGTALSQQTLDSLLELNLIAPKGRRETPGPADTVGHDAGVPGAFRLEGSARIAAAGGSAAGNRPAPDDAGGLAAGFAAAARGGDRVGTLFGQPDRNHFRALSRRTAAK